MTAYVLPRPGRHAMHTAPDVIELLIALIAAVCLLVLEHDAALERVVDFVRLVVYIAGTIALILLPLVTR